MSNKAKQGEIHIIRKKHLAKVVDKALGNNKADDIVTTKPALTQRWEDLDKIYNELASSIAEISIQVSQVVNRYKETSVIVPNEVSLAVKSLYSDLTAMTEDLMGIKAQHTGRVGVVKTEEELAILLDAFNKYFVLFDRFRALTFQELLIITEHTMSVKETTAASPVTVEGEVVEDAVIVEETKAE